MLKNKSSTDLPSSHGGGVLPGNQRGLSGSAATQTVTDRAAVGDVYVLSLNFSPLRKEAFVDPTRDPVFWELEEEMETAAMAEEAQTAAILFLPKDYLPISLCCV